MSEIPVQKQYDEYIDCAPDKFGCEVVGEYDTAGAYEFSTVKVWRHIETGRVFAAYDSGCSCPIPFEGMTWPTDFVEVRTVACLDPLIAQAEYFDSYTPEREALKSATRAALTQKDGE